MKGTVKQNEGIETQNEGTGSIQLINGVQTFIK